MSKKAFDKISKGLHEALEALEAQALAESLAEAERLRDYIDAQRVDNERLQVDLYGARKDRDSWRRAAEEFRTETFAAETQVAALTAANAALRAPLDRWQRTGCPDCGGDCHSANPPVTSCIMQETRATLAQSSGGEVG